MAQEMTAAPKPGPGLSRALLSKQGLGGSGEVIRRMKEIQYRHHAGAEAVGRPPLAPG